MKIIRFEFFLTILFLLVFLRGTAFAQTDLNSKFESTLLNPYSEGVSGVVVANTFTSAGNQFYRLFALAWRDKPESEKYSISVVESRARQRFSLITIYFANKVLYNAVLPARFSALQALVDQSIDAVSSGLLTIELSTSETDSDLAADEM